MTSSAVLLLACPDRPGMVSQVSTHIAEQGGNILRAEQSEAVADSHFYQRIHFDYPGGSIDLDAFPGWICPSRPTTRRGLVVARDGCPAADRDPGLPASSLSVRPARPARPARAAVRAHLEHRVIVAGRRTIVFE